MDPGVPFRQVGTREQKDETGNLIKTTIRRASDHRLQTDQPHETRTKLEVKERLMWQPSSFTCYDAQNFADLREIPCVRPWFHMS